MQLVAFPASPAADAPFAESPHARAFLLPPGGPAPDGTDVLLEMPDGARFAYAPRAPGGPAAFVTYDPFVRGNQFRPLHESDRALAALVSLAASRRLDTGPESERLFLFLRGSGLLTLESGDVERFAPNTIAVVPAGEPVRVWAQGPEDVLAIVFQPRGQKEERRTLAGEIAKRRASSL